MPADAHSPDHLCTQQEQKVLVCAKEMKQGSFLRPSSNPTKDDVRLSPGMVRRTFLRCLIFAALGSSFRFGQPAGVPLSPDTCLKQSPVDDQAKILPRPYCLSAEMRMLGLMLIFPQKVISDFVEDGVSKAWFYQRAHATIYSVLVEAWSARKPCDLITLTQTLRKRQLLQAVGGPAFLTDLVDCVTPVAANASYYRDIVGEKYALRQTLL